MFIKEKRSTGGGSGSGGYRVGEYSISKHRRIRSKNGASARMENGRSDDDEDDHDIQLSRINHSTGLKGLDGRAHSGAATTWISSTKGDDESDKTILRSNGEAEDLSVAGEDANSDYDQRHGRDRGGLSPAESSSPGTASGGQPGPAAFPVDYLDSGHDRSRV